MPKSTRRYGVVSVVRGEWSKPSSSPIVQDLHMRVGGEDHGRTKERSRSGSNRGEQELSVQVDSALAILNKLTSGRSFTIAGWNSESLDFLSERWNFLHWSLVPSSLLRWIYMWTYSITWNFHFLSRGEWKIEIYLSRPSHASSKMKDGEL